MKKYAIALVILLISLNFVSAEKTVLIDKYHDTDNWWGDLKAQVVYSFKNCHQWDLKIKLVLSLLQKKILET